ncbi:MAG: GIY-YIG nuclease family protein [Bacteroidota bacterium]|nr:GIY-YIG nuclease family protein [Bacteroidota bacterium]
MYSVYVLYSPTFHQVYTGQTQNVILRLNRHNKRLVLSTKRYCPWELVYTEEYKTRSEAMKREKFLKSGKGRDYLRSLHLF